MRPRLESLNLGSPVSTLEAATAPDRHLEAHPPGGAGCRKHAAEGRHLQFARMPLWRRIFGDICPLPACPPLTPAVEWAIVEPRVVGHATLRPAAVVGPLPLALRQKHGRQWHAPRPPLSPLPLCSPHLRSLFFCVFFSPSPLFPFSLAMAPGTTGGPAMSRQAIYGCQPVPVRASDMRATSLQRGRLVCCWVGCRCRWADGGAARSTATRAPAAAPPAKTFAVPAKRPWPWALTKRLGHLLLPVCRSPGGLARRLPGTSSWLG